MDRGSTYLGNSGMTLLEPRRAGEGIQSNKDEFHHMICNRKVWNKPQHVSCHQNMHGRLLLLPAIVLVVSVEIPIVAVPS